MDKDRVELAPLRDLDDFLFGSARFQLPNYRDMDKWANRVAQNLMYYQTNYFLLGLCIILLASLISPIHTMFGTAAFAVAMGLLIYFRYPTSSMARFRKQHTLVSIGVGIAGLVFIYCLFTSLVTFLFTILLPISIAFVHSSLRLRNLKNKISNIGKEIYGRTPMGVFLELLESYGRQDGTVTTKFKNKRFER